MVPARNEHDHIKRCLLSLHAQNYPNFEVIAIDDGSTDNTLKIMKEIERTVVPKDILKIISLANNVIAGLARHGLHNKDIYAAEERYCCLQMLIPIIAAKIRF
jgi:glycosyltransferase involved in cell wall biosynthesis